MNLITAENRELALSMSINQRNPHEPSKVRYGGLLLGTDFRHAVEFSRSGRARSPTNSLAVLRGGDFHSTPSSAAVERGVLPAVSQALRPGPFSLGAWRTVHAF